MSNFIEIICIGTELLIGNTLNTNAHWLAKEITSIGLNVNRITIIHDKIDEIAKVVRTALHRKPIFIITCGGLGPTFDDKTLKGIAKVLECKIKINQEAYKMVEEKYQTYLQKGIIKEIEFTPSRIKMAKLPEGSGWGVKLDENALEKYATGDTIVLEK